MLISIVIPMYFEEAVANECHRRLQAVMQSLANTLDYELIFVNDGSRDQTPEILNRIAQDDPHSRVIHFSRNFGHQNAVTAGILESRGDAVILIDADLQDPPELIPAMIEKWQEGYEVVYATRASRAGESRFKLWSATLFYRVLDSLSDTKIPRNTGDFRLMDRRVVEAFRQMPEKNKFIRGMVSWIGYRQTAIEYQRQERLAGETHYTLKKMVRLAMDGIMSFSTKPLKIVTSIGFFTVLISFLVLIYALVQKFRGHTDAGWASLMTAITFFSGIQLISLGIIGGYIGRIYEEARNRPNYIIADKRGFTHDMSTAPDESPKR